MKFTQEQLNKAKELAYINWENDGDIGFLFQGTWITNPFIEDTGRFDFVDYDAMCSYYGKRKVTSFIKKILEMGVDKTRIYENVELEKSVAGRFKEYCRDMHLTFETSEVGELIHFEVLVNEEEKRKANEFLDTL